MTKRISHIQHPDDVALDELCDELSELASNLETDDAWPARQLEQCGRHGVFEWFVPKELGGQGWSEVDLVRGYLRLERRLPDHDVYHHPAYGRVSPHCAGGQPVGAAGVLARADQRTTIRDGGRVALDDEPPPFGAPVLSAEILAGSVVLDGYSPWVTGAEYARWIVIGATVDDGRQVLVVVPRHLPG